MATVAEAEQVEVARKADRKGRLADPTQSSDPLHAKFGSSKVRSLPHRGSKPAPSPDIANPDPVLISLRSPRSRLRTEPRTTTCIRPVMLPGAEVTERVGVLDAPVPSTRINGSASHSRDASTRFVGVRSPPGAFLTG